MSAVVTYLIQMCIPALAGAVLWGLTKPIRRLSGPCRETALLLFFMFTAGLLALTLTPSGFWDSVLRWEMPYFPPPFRGGVNLVPFRRSWDLFRYYRNHGLWTVIAVNFPGNILMFAPIGFFSALLSDKPRWWKSAMWTFAFSFSIEFFQLFISRGTDIDDLILNTLGGILGYWFFLVFRRLWPDVAEKCAKQRRNT